MAGETAKLVRSFGAARPSQESLQHLVSQQNPQLWVVCTGSSITSGEKKQKNQYIN